MTVSATELIAAAQKALQASDCEADWRGVCARSYYAIFRDGENFHNALPSPGSLNPDSQGGMHEDLIERLKNPTISKENPDNSKSRRIGNLMASLHAARVRADYKRHKDVDKVMAKNAAVEAQTVWDLLNDKNPPSKPAVTVSESPSANPSRDTSGETRPTLTRIK